MFLPHGTRTYCSHWSEKRSREMSVIPARISPTTCGTSSSTICSLMRWKALLGTVRDPLKDLLRHVWHKHINVLLSCAHLENAHPCRDVRHGHFDSLVPDEHGRALLEKVLDPPKDLFHDGRHEHIDCLLLVRSGLCSGGLSVTSRKISWVFSVLCDMGTSSV